MKEYWVTPEEAKDIIEVHNLIDKAFDDINMFYSKEDFDEYAIAKQVYRDIDDMMKSVSETVWWTEECNNLMFQLIRDRFKQIPCKYEIYRQQSLTERIKSLQNKYKEQ